MLKGRRARFDADRFNRFIERELAHRQGVHVNEYEMKIQNKTKATAPGCKKRKIIRSTVQIFLCFTVDFFCKSFFLSYLIFFRV